MIRGFSFSGDLASYLLENITILVPGIEKVIAVSGRENNRDLVFISGRKEQGELVIEEYLPEGDLEYFRKLQEGTVPYSWLLKEEIPFQVRSGQKVQLEVFNELSNNVLLLRIPVREQSHGCLFFLFFDRGLNSFGTIQVKHILSTENKTIIGQLVRNALLAMISVFYSDRNALATVHENTRAIMQDLEAVRSEFSSLKDQYREGILKLCHGYLDRLASDRTRRYRFSEGAIQKLSVYAGDVLKLQVMIEKAVEYADTLALETSGNETIVTDFHIVFPAEKQIRQEKILSGHVGDVPAKYGKTVMLLDRLEKAAMDVKAKNRLLTSQNIGRELPSPVSPPAISDALKKHRSKILHLFNEFPGRWEIIRNEFRPVQNILNIRKEPDQRSA
jgi:hypothetical protein